MTAGSIISGGFGLVRRHPGAVALWTLLYLVVTVAAGFAMRPIMASFAQIGEAGAGSPAAAATVSSAMSGLFLVELAILAVMIILFAAAQRAVLQPERQGFAFLRIGMDELRLFGLAALFFILFYLGMLAVAVVVALLAALAAVTAGAVAAVPVAFVGILAFLGVTVWLQVRLSMTFPVTMIRGKFSLEEGWRATRGHFWPLFLAYLALFLILSVLWVGAVLVTSGPYFADIATFGFTPEGLQRAGERQLERQFGPLTSTMVLGWGLSALAGSLSIAIFGGALATAAREAIGDSDGLAETFA